MSDDARVEGELAEMAADDARVELERLRAENIILRSQPLGDACARLYVRISELEARHAALDVPELERFVAGVVREAAHQRKRWGSSHDGRKGPEDWFWLLGYLAGKALRAALSGAWDKALHHTISSAAALANWHAALLEQRERSRAARAAKEAAKIGGTEG